MPDSSPRAVRLDYAGNPIFVSVSFRMRERLSISVHPDGSVTAVAPSGKSMDDVLRHLNMRRSWIAKQRRHFEKYHPLPDHMRYVPGESHIYLGRQYRLRVKQSHETRVKLVGKYFEVSIPTPRQPRTIEAAMDKWYQSHAEGIFQDRLKRCVESTAALRSCGQPRLRIRPMERRWGSCSQAGTITLNTHLVKMPLQCIDYVIIHELCHLRIHNHGPLFYRLLNRSMPDWRQCKSRLDAVVLR